MATMHKARKGAGEPEAATTEGGIDLVAVLRVLYRRKLAILALVLATSALAALVAHQQVPRYTASAQVLIDPRPARIVHMEAVAASLGRDPGTLETQIELIGSRVHARRVVDHLGLLEDPELNPALRPGRPGLALLLERPLSWLEAVLEEAELIGTGRAAGTEVRMTAAEQHDATVAALQARLRASQHGRAHIIRIEARAHDPAKAARIANAAARLYVEGLHDAKLSATREAALWLEARIEELGASLRASEAEAERLRIEHDLIEAKGQTLGEQELAELHHRLLESRALRAGREATWRLVGEIRARGQGQEALTEVLDSPVIRDLRREEAQLIRARAQLAQDYGARHPRIQQLQAELDGLRAKIGGEIDSILGSLGNELAIARAREQALSASLAEARAAAASARQVALRLGELEREIAAGRALHETYRQRLKEARAQEDMLEADARIVSEAVPPTRPDFPQPGLILAVGVLSGLLLAAPLAFLLERLDSGLRSPGQVERALGLDVLGLVPLVGHPDRPLHRYLLDRPLSAYAEAVRGVLTVLRLSDDARPPKVVLVTSALPGEGKSTLAASLAACAARGGLRTLLVDLDLRRPSVHRLAAEPPRAGLVELLAGACDPEAALLADERLANLHLLPVRRLSARPAELIGSPKMKALLGELRAGYDLILLDGTPVLGLSDAKVGARLADVALLALRWGRTRAELAQRALGGLLDVRAEIAGVVLTQVDVRRQARYGYDEVGRYYRELEGYYADDHQPPPGAG